MAGYLTYQIIERVLPCCLCRPWGKAGNYFVVRRSYDMIRVFICLISAHNLIKVGSSLGHVAIIGSEMSFIR